MNPNPPPSLSQTSHSHPPFISFFCGDIFQGKESRFLFSRWLAELHMKTPAASGVSCYRQQRHSMQTVFTLLFFFLDCVRTFNVAQRDVRAVEEDDKDSEWLFLWAVDPSAVCLINPLVLRLKSV